MSIVMYICIVVLMNKYIMIDVNASCLALYVNRSMCYEYSSEDELVVMLDGIVPAWRVCEEPALTFTPQQTIQPPTPTPTPSAQHIAVSMSELYVNIGCGYNNIYAFEPYGVRIGSAYEWYGSDDTRAFCSLIASNIYSASIAITQTFSTAAMLAVGYDGDERHEMRYMIDPMHLDGMFCEPYNMEIISPRGVSIVDEHTIKFAFDNQYPIAFSTMLEFGFYRCGDGWCMEYNITSPPYTLHSHNITSLVGVLAERGVAAINATLVVGDESMPALVFMYDDVAYHINLSTEYSTDAYAGRVYMFNVVKSNNYIYIYNSINSDDYVCEIYRDEMGIAPTPTPTPHTSSGYDGGEIELALIFMYRYGRTRCMLYLVDSMNNKTVGTFSPIISCSSYNGRNAYLMNVDPSHFVFGKYANDNGDVNATFIIDPSIGLASLCVFDESSPLNISWYISMYNDASYKIDMSKYGEWDVCVKYVGVNRWGDTVRYRSTGISIEHEYTGDNYLLNTQYTERPARPAPIDDLDENTMFDRPIAWSWPKVGVDEVFSIDVGYNYSVYGYGYVDMLKYFGYYNSKIYMHGDDVCTANADGTYNHTITYAQHGSYYMINASLNNTRVGCGYNTTLIANTVYDTVSMLFEPTPTPAPTACEVDMMIVCEFGFEYGVVGFGMYLVNEYDEVIGTFTPRTRFYDMCEEGSMVCGGYDILYSLFNNISEVYATVALNATSITLRDAAHQLELMWYVDSYVEVGYSVDLNKNMEWSCVIRKEKCDEDMYRTTYRVSGMSMDVGYVEKKCLVALPLEYVGDTYSIGRRCAPVSPASITTAEYADTSIAWSWPVVDNSSYVYMYTVPAKYDYSFIREQSFGGESNHGCFNGSIQRKDNGDGTYNYTMIFSTAKEYSFIVCICCTRLDISSGDVALITDTRMGSASIRVSNMKYSEVCRVYNSRKVSITAAVGSSVDYTAYNIFYYVSYMRIAVYADDGTMLWKGSNYTADIFNNILLLDDKSTYDVSVSVDGRANIVHMSISDGSGKEIAAQSFSVCDVWESELAMCDTYIANGRFMCTNNAYSDGYVALG